MQTIKYLFVAAILLLAGGCKKFLDKKSDQRLMIIRNLDELQALLNDPLTSLVDPALSEVSSDDYYINNTDWDNFAATGAYWNQRPYIWSNDDPYGERSGQTVFDWRYAYDNVFRANTVLSEIDKVSSPSDGGGRYDFLKGQAYYLRGKCFLDILLAWAKAYDESTADTDHGIPLRLDPDFNPVSTRATVRQSYQQVLADMKAAAALLPHSTSHVLRPSKAAAYGMVARTYLAMRNYDSAYHYAGLSLSEKSDLLNYNTLSSSPSYPIPRFHVEILCYSYRLSPTVLGSTRAKIDSNLYQQFAASDLRKTLFFRNNNNGSYGFRGSYSTSNSVFSGIATDEVWLMLAECQARKNMVPAAMQSLNNLLRNRWRTGTFTDLTATTASEALAIILQERRKQLIFRGLRWMDIKRLNKEGYNIIPRRFIHGTIYELQPNSSGYARPIPLTVIDRTGMPQNE